MSVKSAEKKRKVLNNRRQVRKCSAEGFALHVLPGPCMKKVVSKERLNSDIADVMSKRAAT